MNIDDGTDGPSDSNAADSFEEATSSVAIQDTVGLDDDADGRDGEADGLTGILNVDLDSSPIHDKDILGAILTHGIRQQSITIAINWIITDNRNF